MLLVAMTILQSTATAVGGNAAASAVVDDDDAGGDGYNHRRYNEIIQPELLDSIQRDLPKEAKFFDEIDCKYMRSFVVIEN